MSRNADHEPGAARTQGRAPERAGGADPAQGSASSARSPLGADQASGEIGAGSRPRLPRPDGSLPSAPATPAAWSSASPGPVAGPSMPPGPAAPVPAPNTAVDVGALLSSLQDDLAGEDQGSAPGRVNPVLTTVMRPEGPDMTQLVRSSTETVLPRKPGLLGDVRYVFTVLAGTARTRRKIEELRVRLNVEREHRETLLIALGREQVTGASVDDPIVVDARTRLAEIETRRAQAASEAAAAAAEVWVLEQEHQAEVITVRTELEILAEAVAEVDRTLAPLDREQAEARKNLQDLRATSKVLDKQIRKLEQRLRSVRHSDAGAIEAELAAVRAELEAVLREQPVVETAMDEREPRLASLRAARQEREQERAAMGEREPTVGAGSQTRCAAAAERKAAAEQTVAESQAEVREVLRGLGEQLSIDRPVEVTGRLRIIDRRDLTVATLERQLLECHEILRSVDRWAVVRGALVLVAYAGALAAVVWVVLTRL